MSRSHFSRRRAQPAGHGSQAPVKPDNGNLESWKPRPGDKLVGHLVRYEPDRAPHGEPFLVFLELLDVDDEDRGLIGRPYLVGGCLAKVDRPAEGGGQ